jgi:hypothetical protein
VSAITASASSPPAPPSPGPSLKPSVSSGPPVSSSQLELTALVSSLKKDYEGQLWVNNQTAYPLFCNVDSPHFVCRTELSKIRYVVVTPELLDSVRLTPSTPIPPKTSAVFSSSAGRKGKGQMVVVTAALTLSAE